MRFTVLGSGGVAVPSIGASSSSGGDVVRGTFAHVLQPRYPASPTLLIDAGADLWSQWRRWHEAPLRPDAVLVTHCHADHVAGLQHFAYSDPPMPIYGSPRTIADLKHFLPDITPKLDLRLLPEEGTLMVAGVLVETVVLAHSLPVTGIIVRHDGHTFVHLGDTGPVIGESVRMTIRGCDMLVVNTPLFGETAEHISIPGAIALAADIAAKRLILAHLGHSVSTQTIAEIKAAHTGVAVAIDGSVFDC